MIERHALLCPGGRPKLQSEALAAGLVARFLSAMQTNAPRIACWIAEQNSAARVGAALLTEDSETRARIELLFVEPSARRRGLGERLVATCTNFAYGARYEQVICRLEEPREDVCGLLMRTGFTPVHDGSTDVVWQRKLQQMCVD